MHLGFTATVRDGGATVAVHGAATGLVSIARGAAAAVALIGRLYYRDDRLNRLRGRLSAAAMAACRADDAALVLRLFEEFGPPALEDLEGDFALVAWDAAGRRLHAVRDPMGGFPLFWATGPDGFALGTSMGPLLAYHGRRVVNRLYVAEYLTGCGQQNEGQSEECVYEGVRRVMPGSAVVIDATTRRVHRRAYWNWADRVSDPGTDRIDEAGVAYGELLRGAVRERSRGRTLAHLSGGMDSTGVALVARDLVRGGGVAGPLHCASVVYERLPKLRRETPFVEGVLGGLDGVAVHRVLGDDLLDYDAFGNSPPHDEPYPGLWRLQMDRALIREAIRVGAGTVLTGIGADEVCGQQPYHLADLVRRGRLATAWVEARRWARAYNCSKWVLLREFALAPLGWHRRPAAAAGASALHRQSDTTVPPWVCPAFAREFDLDTRLRERARRTFTGHPQAALAVAITGLRAECGDPVRWAVAAPAGVTTAHPFLDPRVLTFGLGVRQRIPPEPGRMKPLLATALRDVLPREILHRRAKGHFDEVYYRGLARNLSRLEAVVRSARPAGLGVFIPEALAGVLHEASLAGPDGRKLQRLDHSLALVEWLAHEREWCQDRCDPARARPFAAPVSEPRP